MFLAKKYNPTEWQKVAKKMLHHIAHQKLNHSVDIVLSANKVLQQSAQKIKRYSRFSQITNECWAVMGNMRRLVQYSINGSYKGISNRNLLITIATLTYFVMPLDALPDALPVVGLLDDFNLMFWVINNMHTEYSAFLEWERSGSPYPNDDPSENPSDVYNQ